MVKCCGGLPLAITVLGGLLATRHTEGEWERAHFPEDFEISTKELIRMWMGEGFLPKFQHGGGREDTMEDVGERYLRELAQGENFLQITNIHSMEVSEAHIGKIRRLAINWGQDDFSAKRDRDDCDPMLPLMISKKYPHVRSGGWRKEPCPVSAVCKLTNCRGLKTIPDGLRFVTTLQELEIKDMPKTFKDRVDKGGEDFCKELEIKDMPKTFKDRVDKGGEDFCKVQHVPSLVFQHCDGDGDEE
uniref:Disease resistance protein winged helix domain-containing protein n=1 Tax=Fagus sylvatica TaxID=28930 RepID=A0A2N9FB85_FAGSY